MDIVFLSDDLEDLCSNERRQKRDGGVRLVFDSADSPIPLNEDFSINWPQVRRVRIVYIGDYHD